MPKYVTSDPTKLNISTSSGKKAENTQVLSGKASEPAGWRAKNDTDQHSVASGVSGPYGGKKRG